MIRVGGAIQWQLSSGPVSVAWINNTALQLLPQYFKEVDMLGIEYIGIIPKCSISFGGRRFSTRNAGKKKVEEYLWNFLAPKLLRAGARGTQTAESLQGYRIHPHGTGQ